MTSRRDLSSSYLCVQPVQHRQAVHADQDAIAEHVVYNGLHRMRPSWRLRVSGLSDNTTRYAMVTYAATQSVDYMV